MARKSSLKVAAVAKLRSVHQQVQALPDPVQEAMRLADLYEDIRPDEYILPEFEDVPRASSDEERRNFDYAAYSPL